MGDRQPRVGGRTSTTNYYFFAETKDGRDSTEGTEHERDVRKDREGNADTEDRRREAMEGINNEPPCQR